MDCLDLEDKWVEPVVLEVDTDFDRRTGSGMIVLDGLIKKLLSGVQTAYDMRLVSSSMEEEIMCMMWPFARAMVPGQKRDSVEDKRLVMA